MAAWIGVVFLVMTGHIFLALTLAFITVIFGD